MRKISSRLTILVFILVIASSILFLVFSSLTRNGIIFVRDQMRYMMFGYAFRDVLLLVVALVALVVSVFRVSRSATDPIVKVTGAMQEVAMGNFDVQVSLRENVNELQQLQNGFNMMVNDLKNNAYLRRDFMSNVSHELKTPLAIMNGYAKLLQEDGLTDGERAEYAGFIAEESERLIKVTANMLRLCKIDAEHAVFANDVFSLDEQIRTAILLLESRWNGKNIAVNVDLREIEYTGDADLLSQVWINLIENAIKYTPEGGTIDVCMMESTDGITVSVADSGEGMTPDTMEHMFEMFYQGDPSHKKEGSGLGLSIVKRIVEMHGGSIAVASAPGAGSRFDITLPFRELSK